MSNSIVHDYAAIKAVLNVWKPEPRKEPENTYTVKPETPALEDEQYGMYVAGSGDYSCLGTM